MYSEKDIITKVEQLRTELGRLVLKYGIKSSQVLSMSQHLDEALNQYYELVIKKKSS